MMRFKRAAPILLMLGALCSGTYLVIEKQRVIAKDTSDVVLPEHAKKTRGNGIPRRPFDAANMMNWNGNVWSISSFINYEELSQDSMDMYQEQSSDPERWNESMLWLMDRNRIREDLADCNERSRDLQSVCVIKYHMVAERDSSDTAIINYIRPEFVSGEEDAACRDYGQCKARIRFRERMPVPNEDQKFYAFEKEAKIGPAKGSPLESEGWVENRIQILQRKLADLEESKGLEQDAGWEYRKKLYGSNLEYWNWVLENLE